MLFTLYQHCRKYHCCVIAHVHNRSREAHAILMFACAKKVLGNAVMPQRLIVSILVNRQNHDRVLFDIFLETNKQQNLMRLRCSIDLVCFSDVYQKLRISACNIYTFRLFIYIVFQHKQACDCLVLLGLVIAIFHQHIILKST